MLKPPKRKPSPRKRARAMPPKPKPPWHRKNIKEGVMFGWKKAKYVRYGDCRVQQVLVKLRIPADARAILALQDNSGGHPNYMKKCRASKAVVLGFYELDGTPLRCVSEAYSSFDHGFTYSKGDILTPRHAKFSNHLVACAPGIHFFRTKQQAVAYNLL